MSSELLQVLRGRPGWMLLSILGWLRNHDSPLVDELEVFLSAYPEAMRERAVFFLPEYDVSDRLADILQLNPGLPLVELGIALRTRGGNKLANELSNLIEMFPGLGTTDALLPSFAQS